MKSRPAIRSVGDFLLQIKQIKSTWFGDDKLSPWYRGQTRAQWGLQPSLYRVLAPYEDIRRHNTEDEIREEFIIRAPVFSQFRPAGDDDWEWYFLMQHYGAPTRLLDWTEGALLALYFAVRDNRGHFDSAVWVLDPYRLNRHVMGVYEVIAPSAQGVSRGDRQRLRKWLPTRFTEMRIPQKPIAVFPTHIAPRISTQRSCFTVHGSDVRGLERLGKIRNPLVQELVVPSFCVREVKQELIDSGIDEVTIFPDLDGLGKAISTGYSQEKEVLPHSGVVTELRPSKAYPGRVGVFALARINKGTPLFRGENEEIVWLDKKQVARERLAKWRRKLYADFALDRDSRFGCPISFNRLTVAWYLKPAKKGLRPNVQPNRFYEFYAIRNIRPGAELIADFTPPVWGEDKPRRGESSLDLLDRGGVSAPTVR